MATHYTVYNAKHHRHIRRLKRTLAALGIVFLLLGSWLLNSWLVGPDDSAENVASTPKTRVQQPTTEVFRTSYFQFQAGDEWAEDARESTSSRFVYRAYQGSLIHQDLTIYVNTAQVLPAVSYVQPVKIMTGGLLQSVGSISEHCNKSAPEGEKDNIPLTHAKVSLLCDTDGTIFMVLVGVQNGNGTISLLRPDGDKADYTIIYRDLRAQPNGQELAGILRTFQTR